MVVGGIAAVLHGVGRVTMDVDVVVALDEQNAKAAIAAIETVGFRSMLPISKEDFADESIRSRWIAEKNMLVLNFVHDKDMFQRVDFFVTYPIDFDELLRDSVVKDGDGVPTRVCSIDHLIRMKLMAGRPKDLMDVRQLEMIRDSEA